MEVAEGDLAGGRAACAAGEQLLAVLDTARTEKLSTPSSRPISDQVLMKVYCGRWRPIGDTGKYSHDGTLELEAMEALYSVDSR